MRNILALTTRPFLCNNIFGFWILCPNNNSMIAVIVVYYEWKLHRIMNNQLIIIMNWWFECYAHRSPLHHSTFMSFMTWPTFSYLSTNLATQLTATCVHNMADLNSFDVLISLYVSIGCFSLALSMCRNDGRAFEI